MEEQLNDSIGNLTDKLGGWLNIIITNLPNILLAALVFALAYFLAQKLNELIMKILKSKIRQVSVRTLIANVSSVVVVSLGIFLALSILNLDKALTSILAGAGVAGLAVGLALQGTIANTFSGIFLAVQDIMNVGDFIQTNGYTGVVDTITLRYIKLKESDNNLVIIPNTMVVENPFKNFGLTTEVLVSIECGVGYESDLRNVKKIAIEEIERVFPQGSREIEFHYLEFGDSSINFQIRFWVDATKTLTVLESKSEAIMALKERFDKENINIPYPVRTLIAENSFTKNSVENSLV
jgi:small conductance mechanosensitive channel